MSPTPCSMAVSIFKFLSLFIIPSFLLRQWAVGPDEYIPVPGVHLRRSHGINLSPPLSTFLASKNPLVSDQFRETYGLPTEFLVQLKAAAEKSPVNEKTGNHLVIFTLFNDGHFGLALNLLCSSRAAGVPSNMHLFIALDKQAREKMLPHYPNVMLLDISGRGYKYHQFCRVKMFVHYQLLLWGIEAVVCDDDLVILRNPLELFREQSHFELSTECRCAAFGPGYDYNKFNIGFMRVIPTVTSILTYEYWIKVAVPRHKILEQDVIQWFMKPLKVSGNSDIQEYRLPTGDHVVFRYFEPTDVMNGGLIRTNWTAMVREVRRRGVEKPYVVHAAWIQPRQKYSFLKSMGLWFLRDEKCDASMIPKRFPR